MELILSVVRGEIIREERFSPKLRKESSRVQDFWQVFPPHTPDTRLNRQCVAEVNHPPCTMILIAPSEELPDNLSLWKAVSTFLSSAPATWASALSRGAGVQCVARPAAAAICRTL